MRKVERLQKYLAASGVASRRKAEELIRQGRVTVNGKRAVLGTKVQPGKDVIRVDGKEVRKEEKVYILLYKPRGVITTCFDPQGRPTVRDLFPGIPASVHPVGRLDYDTEGLLLLTNDGKLTYLLTHPRHEVSKTYQVLVAGKPTWGDIKQLEQGVLLEDGRTAPAKVRVLGYHGRGTLLEMTIHEGRKRQIRRMCATLGYPVLKLKRTQIGFLTLGRLQPGGYRYLTPVEVRKLRRLARGKAGKPQN